MLQPPVHLYLAPWQERFMPISEPLHKIKTEAIIDSEAIGHMVPNQSWFQTYHMLNLQILVAFDDDSGVKAIRIETVVFESEVSGNKYKFALHNVLHIPNVKLILLSINCLQSSKLTILFPENTTSCIVTRNQNTIMIASL